MWRLILLLSILTGCTTQVQRYEIVQPTTQQLNPSNQLGQIINGKQQCLTFSAGQIVTLKPCDGGTAQQWLYEPQIAILRNPLSGLCLDIATDTVTSGAFLAGKTCRNVPSQQWFFDRQNLYNSFGWCIDEVKEPSQTVAYLAACSARPAQHFIFTQLNQTITPYLVSPSPTSTSLHQPTVVVYDRPYYSPFFYTYPFFYWGFYYNYYRHPVHHYAPPRYYHPAPLHPVDKGHGKQYGKKRI
jgi:hypothetical protein